jgi:hypothetical protein
MRCHPPIGDYDGSFSLSELIPSASDEQHNLENKDNFIISVIGT